MFRESDEFGLNGTVYPDPFIDPMDDEDLSHIVAFNKEIVDGKYTAMEIDAKDVENDEIGDNNEGRSNRPKNRIHKLLIPVSKTMKGSVYSLDADDEYLKKLKNQIVQLKNVEPEFRKSFNYTLYMNSVLQERKEKEKEQLIEEKKEVERRASALESEIDRLKNNLAASENSRKEFWQEILTLRKANNILYENEKKSKDVARTPAHKYSSKKVKANPSNYQMVLHQHQSEDSQKEEALNGQIRMQESLQLQQYLLDQNKTTINDLETNSDYFFDYGSSFQVDLDDPLDDEDYAALVEFNKALAASKGVDSVMDVDMVPAYDEKAEGDLADDEAAQILSEMGAKFAEPNVVVSGVQLMPSLKHARAAQLFTTGKPGAIENEPMRKKQKKSNF